MWTAQEPSSSISLKRFTSVPVHHSPPPKKDPTSFKYKSIVSANLSQDRQTSEVLATVVAQIQDQFSSIYKRKDLEGNTQGLR
jgi:hypothetical protein